MKRKAVELILIGEHGTGIIDKIEVDRNFAVLLARHCAAPAGKTLRIARLLFAAGIFRHALEQLTGCKNIQGGDSLAMGHPQSASDECSDPSFE